MSGLSIKRNIYKIVVGAVIVLGLGFIISFANQATTYAQTPGTNTATGGAGSPTAGTTTTAGNTNNSPTQTTCAVEKIGWLLCPVIQSAGKIGDALV